MAESLDFLVRRDDLRRTAVVPGRCSADAELEPDEVLVRIDRFALTANNVTYGAVGELVGYWNFFPADAGWGRIPVWGFADVIRSRHDAIERGERLYGYFPMSTHLVLRAAHVSPAGFVDASAHRAALPPVYNSYTRVAADPAYDPSREAGIALFRPLFTTAFLLDDFLAANRFFGAHAAILASASSKTALGLAYLLFAKRRGACQVVGLTSPANTAFVGGTGYYDSVRSYGDVAGLPADAPAVLVDFAGNAAVTAGVHRRLGDALRYSARVGLTHWEKTMSPDPLPGPEPILFFAPDHARRRISDWGAAAFQARVAEAMGRFLDSAGRWLHVVESRGMAALEAAYRAVLDGKANPAEGRIVVL